MLQTEGERVHLVGSCAVEEAESLASLLLADPALRIDVSRCETMHAAVAQVLLAFKPPISGAPPDTFLQDLVRQIARPE